MLAEDTSGSVARLVYPGHQGPAMTGPAQSLHAMRDPHAAPPSAPVLTRREQDMETSETDHLSTVRALAPECMVLLRCDGAFPLAEPGEIALFGSGARRTVKGGL